MGLSGKTAVITGSGRAIGAAIAIRMAQDGANVVLNSRSTPDEIDEIAKECRNYGIKVLTVLADVSTKEGVDKLAQETYQQFPEVDILINNVGISPTCPFLEMTDEEWHKVMAVNIDSIYYCSKAFVPNMVERQWGRVVNITGHAYLGVGGSVHTKSGKSAAVGFTRGLAGEVAPYQITVNHIAPGLIDTPARRNKYYRDDKSDLSKGGNTTDRPWGPEESVEKVPLKRLGKPEEMSALVAFLCSEEGAYLTGQTYLVNGGMTAV